MFLIIIIVFITSFYLYATKHHDYWLKKQVKHKKPVPLFGNNFENQFGRKSITEVSTELYSEYPDEKLVGYYRGTTPELIIRDLNIAKRILTADFSYFYPRGVGRNPDVEHILANLFHADGDYWKLLRKRLTPAFTTAKLKSMFPLIIECAEKLQNVAKSHAIEGKPCDVRELMARFTMEFIGACGFGIQTDAITDENSQFRQLGTIIKTRTMRTILLFTLWELFPVLRKFLYVADKRIEEGIKSIYLGAREKRNGKPCGRNDFIDLLLELEAQGKIKGESVEKCNEDGSPKQIEMEMDLKCMVGQVFVFLAAGFDTSSTATSVTLHYLAYNQEIQKQIQEQIDEVLSKYNDKLCYDAIAQMSLLHMAFKEAMRMFPSLGVLNRVCAKPYNIPKVDVTIDPGVRIVIPIAAMHNDEKYFENPKEFNPSRFSPDSKLRIHKAAYMPFGEGPRMCIGARLGEMQSLAGLAALLHKFTVEPAPNSRKEIQVDHALNVVQSIQGELPVILKFRNS